MIFYYHFNLTIIINYDNIKLANKENKKRSDLNGKRNTKRKDNFRKRKGRFS